MDCILFKLGVGVNARTLAQAASITVAEYLSDSFSSSMQDLYSASFFSSTGVSSGIEMLNQESSDLEKPAKLLNISNGYITNTPTGSGLIKYGAALVPFANSFPRNTKIYELMTSPVRVCSQKSRHLSLP